MPIRRACLTSEMLCSACEQKFANGLISQAEIDTAKAISKLSLKYPSLEKEELENILGIIINSKTSIIFE